MSEPLAHSGGHSLADHLKAVAALAAEFSQPFDAAEPALRWAYLAGLWHDLGKYRPGFQRYVRLADNADAHIEGKVGGRDKTHSAAGALWALQTLEKSHAAQGKLAAQVLAYLIAGHHAGLADWHGDLHERLNTADSQRSAAQVTGRASALAGHCTGNVPTPIHCPNRRRARSGAARRGQSRHCQQCCDPGPSATGPRALGPTVWPVCQRLGHAPPAGPQLAWSGPLRHRWIRPSAMASVD